MSLLIFKYLDCIESNIDLSNEMGIKSFLENSDKEQNE